MEALAARFDESMHIWVGSRIIDGSAFTRRQEGGMNRIHDAVSIVPGKQTDELPLPS